MRRSRTCLIVLGISIPATVSSYPGKVLGKPPEGYKTSLVAVGRFGAIDVTSSFPHGQNISEVNRWISQSA
jgi:hypothetical protein